MSDRWITYNIFYKYQFNFRWHYKNTQTLPQIKMAACDQLISMVLKLIDDSRIEIFTIGGFVEMKINIGLD